MRRTDTKSIKELISDWMAQEPEMHERLLETEAIRLFRQMMGAMAKEIRSCYVRDRILYVRISNGSMRQQLSIAREQLAARINQSVGAAIIDKIVVH